MPNCLPAPARRLALFVAVLALVPAVAMPLAAQTTRSSTRKHTTAKSSSKSSTKASSKSSAKSRSSAKSKAAGTSSKTTTPARAAAAPAARPDSALRAFQVDTVAEPIPETLVPRYPRELRSREARGSVVAEFVVDTTGKVEPGTFRVISSDDSAFTASVRDLLPGARFLPAINEGKVVRQTVRQTFVFDVDVLQRPKGTGTRP